jgi:chlorite dismutase
MNLMSDSTPPAATMAPAIQIPPVPLTLEGACVLHQMMRVRWAEWKAVALPVQRGILKEALPLLIDMEARAEGQSAVYSMLGHKGDLLFLHFRGSFDELNEAELAIRRMELSHFLEPVTSYLSVIELGLYDSSLKAYNSLASRGIAPESEEWKTEINQVLVTQRKAMAPRLWPEIPKNRYLCFYPMDRKRGEQRNWYQVPMADRQRMMHDHGMIGRRYAGEVKQIITGSIGFDDWEWGVDLFADDPLVFKKLIYEMRFDEVSAVYALFGTFYVGLRFAAEEMLTYFLEGTLPAWGAQ